MFLKNHHYESVHIIIDMIFTAVTVKISRKKRNVTLYPTDGLRIFPDCTMILPVQLLVCTALMLRMQYIYLFEGAHFHLMLEHCYQVFDAMIFGLAIYLVYLKARICGTMSTYVYDGKRIYMQNPWIVRTSQYFKFIISQLK